MARRVNVPVQQGYDAWARVYDTEGNPLIAQSSRTLIRGRSCDLSLFGELLKPTDTDRSWWSRHPQTPRAASFSSRGAANENRACTRVKHRAN